MDRPRGHRLDGLVQRRRRREVRGVHRVGDAMDVGVAATQRLVQRRAAGHHHVGARQQAGLEPAVAAARHDAAMAVVDDAARLQQFHQGQGCGRVRPDQRVRDAALAHEVAQQARHDGELVVMERAGVAARVRHQRLDARRDLRAREEGVLVRGDRFLDVEDAVAPGEPGHQLLGSLPVEAPAHRGEHHQGRPSGGIVLHDGCGAVRQRVRGGKVHGGPPRTGNAETSCRCCCVWRLSRGAAASKR